MRETRNADWLFVHVSCAVADVGELSTNDAERGNTLYCNYLMPASLADFQNASDFSASWLVEVLTGHFKILFKLFCALKTLLK